MILPVMVVGVMVGIVGSTDRFPAADGPHMLSQAARLSNALLAGEWGWVWEQWFHFTAPHPPVGYVPAILAGLFFDSTRWIVAFADAICLLLLLDAVQRICRKDAWWTGQLAWATGCACSLTWWSSDHYGYDLAAAATVLQAVSWLHRAHTGPRPRDWLFFGFWLAMAFLTKYGAPLICFLPVVWVCGRSVWFRAHHVGLAVLGFVLVAVPYYIENLDTVVPYVRSALNPPDLPGNYPDQRTLLQRFG
ncbi:MAG: glycosyltransferase family 39 protein, partial [Myxococcota bacterium]|nr:glycosyltransferase family 39 protein [Myxococcota bacterium]